MKVQDKKIQTQNLLLINLKINYHQKEFTCLIKYWKKHEFNNYIRLSFTRGNKKDYDFPHFTKIGDLFRRIYKGEVLIVEAEREQESLEHKFRELEKYKPKENSDYYILKHNLYENIKHLKEGRKMIIKAFKDKLFPLIDPKFYPQYREDSSES